MVSVETHIFAFSRSHSHKTTIAQVKEDSIEQINKDDTLFAICNQMQQPTVIPNVPDDTQLGNIKQPVVITYQRKHDSPILVRLSEVENDVRKLKVDNGSLMADNIVLKTFIKSKFPDAPF